MRIMSNFPFCHNIFLREIFHIFKMLSTILYVDHGGKTPWYLVCHKITRSQNLILLLFNKFAANDFENILANTCIWKIYINKSIWVLNKFKNIVAERENCQHILHLPQCFQNLSATGALTMAAGYKGVNRTHGTLVRRNNYIYKIGRIFVIDS